MQVGDIVKGLPNNGYFITGKEMTRGVVTKNIGNSITVRILEHERGSSGLFDVYASGFEVISHVKAFDRDEVLALIREGNTQAIFEYDLRRADLREANLCRADLCRANLRGADLREANLRGADLREANLRGADLRGANLRGADLRGANLRGADLRGADLRGANLRGADLRGADLDFSCWPLWCGSLKGAIVDERLASQLLYHWCSLECDAPWFAAARNSMLEHANKFHRVKECGKLMPIEVPSHD